MRLIDATQLLASINEKGIQVKADWAMEIINAPNIDAEPVRHGKWLITDAYPHRVYCSECHKTFALTRWEVWEDGSLPRNYCPNCGAKMDKE